MLGDGSRSPKWLFVIGYLLFYHLHAFLSSFSIVSSCRTNFHQRPDMEKRSRFGRRDKHSLTHTATMMLEQPMHANDRATVSAASTANTSATTNGKATATPHLLPPVGVLPHSQNATITPTHDMTRPTPFSNCFCGGWTLLCVDEPSHWN